MELRSKGRLGSALALWFLVAEIFHGAEAKSFVQGTRIGCMEEGREVKLNMTISSCYRCMCINGFVECDSLCPSTDGCYALEKDGDSCCVKCKGCVHRGAYRESNTEWKDPNNPCLVYYCHAGVVTEIEVQCRTPCSNPLPPKPGQCCGTCRDCPKIKNHRGSAGRQITLSDPCLKCPCSPGSGMMCTKRACPVLNCPENKLIRKEGECCPRCLGRNEVTSFSVPRTCLAFRRVVKEGDNFTLDHCTKCTCRNSTTICARKTCPVLDCPPVYQKLPPNSCCKECRDPEDSLAEGTLQCILHDKVMEEGEVKQLDSCTVCKCNAGVITYDRTICNESLECPFGSVKVREPNECCSKCVEKPGTCMVFGDPHYKTFDGQFYTFKGEGKYQLTSDCKEHTFSVRVANAYQTKGGTSTTTKRVSIKATGLRINLGQKLVAKVNGKEIPFPYEKDRAFIDKTNNGTTIEVRLHDEIRIVWNGRSFLEVTVPPRYKNRLCGLCGNFNVDSRDDLRDRRGKKYSESSVQHFGNAWCVGRKCTKRGARHPKSCGNNKRKHDRKFCTFFHASNALERCRGKINLEQFHSACLMDMCDCPDGKCYCESLMAYAQECKRLNINVNGWQKESDCEAFGRSQRKRIQIKRKKHSEDLWTKYNVTRSRNYKIVGKGKIPIKPE